MTVHPFKPTPAQIRAALGRTIPDLIGPGLKVLFCGINPGLYSAAVQHHFARPGNRFWQALYAAGMTPRVLSPFEANELLRLGYGITDLVERATAGADDIAPAELVAGVQQLADKAARYKLRYVAVLGIGAYRRAFGRPDAALGPQRETLGCAGLWVLPNPSGLNAYYPSARLGALLGELRVAADRAA